MEKEFKKIYQEIAETVNEMIPEDWEEFHFYAQISETGGGTYFFYKTIGSEPQYKYSLEIPYKQKVDEEVFEQKEDLLYKLGKELRNAFKYHQQELWYSFTMSLERSGEFKLHCDYTNWFDTEYGFSDQRIIWKNKYLGEAPDEEYKSLIDKYDRDFPNDPI